MQPDTRSTNGSVRVWIVEDNEEYARTVQELVDTADGFACPHAFKSGEQLLSFLNDHFAPEVVLVDIGLPGITGIEVVRRVRGISPATQMVMLTIHEDDDRVFEAICAGATGYLTKTATSDRILSSIREVVRGGAPMTPQIARRVLNLFTQVKAPRWDYQLTDREREVLSQLVEGKTKKEIGAQIFLSAHTVDTHLRNIYAKLHVHTRTEAVAKAIIEKLVRPEGAS
jgi:DNA-binding NarL/FixJ family response regulator